MIFFCPLDLGCARVFSKHLDIGYPRQLLVSESGIVSLNTGLLLPCCTAGPVGFSNSISTDFIVLRRHRGSSSSVGFIRLCCSRIPSIRPRHSALCVPIPFEQRRQPIGRPCSLTRHSVTYHRFCVTAGSGTSSSGTSSALTFGKRTSALVFVRDTCNIPPPSKSSAWIERITCELVDVLSSPSPADFGCRLIVRNLRTPCSSPHKCSSVFSFPQPNKLQAVHLKLATQQLCSTHPGPNGFAQTSKPTSALVFASTS